MAYKSKAKKEKQEEKEEGFKVKVCKDCGCECNLRWCKGLDDFIWHCPKCDAEYL